MTRAVRARLDRSAHTDAVNIVDVLLKFLSIKIMIITTPCQTSHLRTNKYYSAEILVKTVSKFPLVIIELAHFQIFCEI